MKAWELQTERRAGRRIPPGLWLDQRMLLYKDVCSLGSQLERVYRAVGADRVHVELLDDLKRDPRTVYLRVLSFLGVEDDGRVNFPKENAGRKISNYTLWRFLRSPVVYWAAIHFKRMFRLKTLGFGRPDLPMPTSVRGFLLEEFDSEIRLVEELLGRNLSSWREQHN